MMIRVDLFVFSLYVCVCVCAHSFKSLERDLQYIITTIHLHTHTRINNKQLTHFTCSSHIRHFFISLCCYFVVVVFVPHSLCPPE